MKKRNLYSFLAAIAAAGTLLGGCASKGDGHTERFALIKTTSSKPMDVRDETDLNEGEEEAVMETIRSFDSIYDAVVIKNGKQILVSYKVKQMHRFQMKKIEKKLKKKLEHNIKDRTFIISSDYKIFLESVRLNEWLRSKDVPEKKAKKKFKEIVNLQKELT